MGVRIEADDSIDESRLAEYILIVDVWALSPWLMMEPPWGYLGLHLKSKSLKMASGPRFLEYALLPTYFLTFWATFPGTRRDGTIDMKYAARPAIYGAAKDVPTSNAFPAL